MSSPDSIEQALKNGFQILVEHGKDEDWDRFLVQVDRNFFARQAELFGSFERTIEDLETRLLPRLTERRDGERFLRWGQAAANLRGLAVTLEGGEVLPALARSGRLGLARTLATQLPGPLRRARALAGIAAADGLPERAVGLLLEELRGDLDEAAVPANRAEAGEWARTVARVGRCLGPALRRRFPAWIDALGPWKAEWKDEIRWEVVTAFFEGGRVEEEDLWRLLAEIEDERRSPRAARAWFAMSSRSEASELLRRLSELVGATPHRRWSFLLPLLAARAVRSGDVADLWADSRERLGEPPWSPELVDLGTGLWGRLPRAEIDAVAGRLDDPLVRGAWSVAVLEGRDGGEPEELAGRALDLLVAMPPGRDQLHWSLRFLAATPGRETPLGSRRLAAVGRHLAELLFEAPAADLARYLDLVAETFPRRLHRQLLAVLWAPGSDVETLRGLVRHARSPALLDELQERAEEHVATVMEDDASGFDLRVEILAELAERRTAAGEEVDLEAIRRRLLPQEEDSLWRAAARGLAASGRFDRASAAAGRIADPALALRVRLEVAGAASPPRVPELTLDELYEAAAGAPVLERELRCLAPLLAAPETAPELAADLLSEVEPRRRTAALVDLARHHWEGQQRRYRPELRDPQAAVRSLEEGLGVVPSDRWLLALTPELVRLSEQLFGARRAASELEEALLRVAGMDDGPWEAREETIVRLLSLAPPCLMRLGPRRRRSLLDRLLRLPEPEARESLRRGWSRIFPWLAAVEHLAAPAGRGWRHRGSDRLCRRWSWLEEEAGRVVEAVLAPVEEAGSAGGSRAVRNARLVMAAAEAPGRVEGLVVELPGDEERHRLVLRLVESGWLQAATARRLIHRLPREKSWRRRGEASLVIEALDERADRLLVSALRALVEEGTVDAGDPRWIWLRNRSWQSGGRVVEALAPSVRRALASGGRRAGECTLGILVGAYLEPCLGEVATKAQRERLSIVERAVEASRSLGAAKVPGAVRGPSG